LKKLLQEEQKRVQNLTMECGKSQEAAKMAMKEVEAVRQEIQEKREHSQHLKENFRRDLIFAESRATIAEVFIDMSIFPLVGSKSELFI